MSNHNIEVLHAALDHPSAHSEHTKLVDERCPNSRAHEVYMWHPCDSFVAVLVARSG